MNEIEKKDAARLDLADENKAQVEEAGRLDRLCNDAIAIVDAARKSAYRSINSAMVYSYYELGRRIVEEEQHGASRAGYGKELMARLANTLTRRYGRGFSETNLRQMRNFYLVYSKDEI